MDRGEQLAWESPSSETTFVDEHQAFMERDTRSSDPCSEPPELNESELVTR